MVHQKILQSDWLRTFWSISHELKFPQTWDLCKNLANINFHYRTNSVKIKYKIFQKIKKTMFLATHFLGQKNFLKNPALSRTTSYWFQTPCQNLEKTNNAIPRKRPDRRKVRRTDRPYFTGPFRLLPGIQQQHCKCKQHTKTKSQPSGLVSPPIYVYMYTLYYIIYVTYITIVSFANSSNSINLHSPWDRS